MRAALLLLAVATVQAQWLADECQYDNDCWAIDGGYCDTDMCACDDSVDTCDEIMEMNGFLCSVDGYVNLVDEGMEVALAGLSILKQIGSTILPADLRKSVDYAWKGLKGAGAWMGFALAAGRRYLLSDGLPFFRI